MGYFVQIGVDAILTPVESGLVLPRERLVQNYTLLNNIALSSVTEVDYEILIVGDVEIDHTTLSTNEMRRAKEALVFYVDGDVSALSFGEIADVLQTHFQGYPLYHPLVTKTN